MKKIVLSAIAIAFTLCGCTSHDEGNVNEYNNALIKENAQKVFGNIDAAQDWNSIKQGSVTITADANLDNIEKVQILTESPFGNKDAAILNEAKVEKGQKVTLVYDAPNVYDKLFAACVSSEGKYFVKVFNIGESSVSFKSTATARMTRSGEGYPSLASIVLGTPTPSFNAQRAIQSQASEDHTVLINDNVGGGNYRAYDLWADGSWANEKMFAVTSTPDNGWTFENGTIWKTVDDDVYITTVKEIVNEFLSKTGAIHTTNNKSNNWETIVESTPYFVLNKNYLIATGEPVTITPIQMNTTEGKFNTVYYYYFDPKVTKDMTAEEEANYIKALPKYKAINGLESKDFKREKQYLLPYYGDGVPAAGAKAEKIGIPEGYKIGFLNQKAKTPAYPNYTVGNMTPEAYNYCGSGCTYSDGRLNKEVNHLIGHFFSAIDKNISQTTKKVYTNSTQTATESGSTENGMKWNSPRVAIFGVNDHAYMCFEDGADCTFGDMIIEVTNGAKVEDEEIIPFGEKYTMCFEDRLENADYDMNDVVLQAVRLNETKVQLSLIASGANDELWIKGLDGSNLASKEVHQLFGYDKSTVFINTTKGGEKKAPIVEEFDIAKTQSISDFLKKITIKNESTGKTIAMPKAGEPPYAIIVPVDFKYPIEKTSIIEAYPNFSIWAKDATRPGNWYLNGVEGLIYE